MGLLELEQNLFGYNGNAAGATMPRIWNFPNSYKATRLQSRDISADRFSRSAKDFGKRCNADLPLFNFSEKPKSRWR